MGFRKQIVYTVHEPIGPPSDRIDRAARMLFVRDGFSIVAAVFAPLWLLANRLWLWLLGYLAAVGGLALLLYLIDAASSWGVLAGVGLHLAVGFEAGSLRRQALARRGWQTAGTASGATLAECERRFFDDWLPRQPARVIPDELADAGSLSAPAKPRRFWFGARG